MKQALSTLLLAVGLLFAPGAAPSAAIRPSFAPQAQAKAQCRDGTLSYSQHRSGTCSHHGGVAKWLAPAPPKPATTYKNSDGQVVKSPEKAASAPAGATAQCRDGSYSFSRHRSGTCSHHGGVGKWLN